MTDAVDRRLMRRALRLAERGWGRVEPNPLVGAIVARGGEVVGEGVHAEYGGPHAEVEALLNAGEAARGATLYVTLEPCTHHGKTPPCTDAILAAGIRRVVFAARDPDPRAGGGAQLLESGGLEVAGGIGDSAARSLNAPFFHRHERGGCYIALKLALTLDAKLGRPDHRTRITGRAAELAVHRLRAGFGAIMVGIGTVLTDDPQLTVRHGMMPRVPPLRIVIDSMARLPLDGSLASTADSVPVWLFTAASADAGRTAALEARGIRVFRVPYVAGRLDLPSVFERMATEGVQRVLCEGGGHVASSLLAADLVERMYLFYAPRVFGAGVEAFPSAEPFPAEEWRTVAAGRHGQDVLLTLDRNRKA